MKLQNEVNDIVQKTIELYKRKQALEELLKETSDELNELLRKELPNLMLINGIQDGSSVSFENYTIILKHYKDPKIVDENKFYDWLEQSGNSDIINEQIKIDVKYRNDKNEIKQYLDGLGIKANVEKKIHPSTLKSFVKETEIPSGNGIEITDGTVAVIK